MPEQTTDKAAETSKSARKRVKSMRVRYVGFTASGNVNFPRYEMDERENLIQRKIIENNQKLYKHAQVLETVWQPKPLSGLFGNLYPGKEKSPPPRAYHVDLRKRKGEWPGIFQIEKHLAICPALRDEIERLEPGVHRMVPLDITLKNGRKPDIQYYHLYIHHLTYAIHFGKTSKNFHLEPDLTRTFAKVEIEYGPNPHPKTMPLVLRREDVEGMHIWRDMSTNLWFMSEELWSFIHKNKLAPMTASVVLVD